MNTKNIFKVVVMVMLMPAVLLTTSCGKGDDAVTNLEKPANTEAAETAVNKGYALPVTVNVTRQGDATTRAEFNKNGDNKLTFSAGDKLFVNGFHDEAGLYAGTLNYVSEGTFSGTIYIEEETYAPIEDILMHGDADATLLPAGYESYGYLTINDNNTLVKYDDYLSVSDSKAFVASETAKATGVEQLSYEEATGYNNGFALAPQNAVLNFTVTGLEAGEKDVTLNVTRTLYDTDYTVTGSVTPNGSGVATFAIGIPLNDGAIIKNMENNLTVGSSNFTLPSSTTFAAGKIYNITRVANAINGKFTINSSDDQVYFSKGNLRYASSKWSFFDNQYDYYTSYSADAWDKFGLRTSANTYGMNTSTTSDDYSGDFVDWGATIGTGWFTLSKDEWTYLINTRSASTVGGIADGRYAKAKVNDVQGVILFPDTYTHPDGVANPVGINEEGDTGWNENNYSSADWTKMESAGCVFLPAAGYRNGSTVYGAGTGCYYWSATPTPNGTGSAYGVGFYSGYPFPAYYCDRDGGCSVRLVRQVE